MRRNRRRNSWIVSEMPVEVGANGDQTPAGVSDQLLEKGSALTEVLAENEELFELIDDERPTSGNGGRSCGLFGGCDEGGDAEAR